MKYWNSKYELIIRIPYTGEVSANRYLRLGKSGGFYVSPVAKYVKSLIVNIIQRSKLPKELNPKKPFSLVVNVGFPRKFSTRSGDAPNFDKFIRDSVSEGLGVDDAGTATLKQNVEYGLGKDAYIELVLNVVGHLEPSFQMPDSVILLALAGDRDVPLCSSVDSDVISRKDKHEILGIQTKRRKVAVTPKRPKLLRYYKKPNG